MKTKIVLFITFLMISTTSYAIERDYIFQGNNENGGFGGPVLRAADINGNVQAMGGMRGAWLINHRYYLGGALYSVFNEIEKTNLKLTYGGLWLGMIFEPAKLTNFSVDILLGGGDLRDGNYSTDNTFYGSRDSFLLAEPSVNVNLNLSKLTKLEFGLSYRFVTGSDKTRLSNSNLRGASFNIGLMIGVF